MEASNRAVDIIHHLGMCVAAGDETPGAWRQLGEALLRTPDVRGVLLAVWDDAASPPPVLLGDLPCPVAQVVEAARATRWSSSPEGVVIAAALPLPGSVLAVALGSPEKPLGLVALSVSELDSRLARLAEGTASALTAALQRRQLARETQRLDASLAEQATRMGELAAVSQLTASVAHELRNPLSSIKGAAQYLRNEYHGEPMIQEFLDIILEEVGVLSRITSEFLDFARPMHLNLETAHLHDNIRRLLQVVKPQLVAHGIEVVQEFGADVPPTVFDPQQVDHAIRNVVVNAIQSMKDGGTLTIYTRYVLSPLPAVEIAVSDTGPGIRPEDLGKLFTPFFTTKTKGVGLGLTIVQKILQNHGGSISVESQLGAGSTFTLRLPSSASAESMRVGRP